MKIWYLAVISSALLAFAIARPEGNPVVEFLDQVREYLETQEDESFGEIC